MKQQIKHFRALDKWFKTPLGSCLANAFCRELTQANDYLRGECLIQLGTCGANSWLKQLPYTHRWIASPFATKEPNYIECSLNHLPIDRASVDCIIAPLTLEAFAGDLNLLDEIDRILKPLGHVLFLGVNPWSLWGAAVKCSLLDFYNEKHIRLRTPMHVNRIFTQRGYLQCSLTSICYIPPINNQNIINKLLFIEEVGRMVWPLPSGIYCYIAQKYDLIQPSFTLKPLNDFIPAGFHPVVS